MTKRILIYGDSNTYGVDIENFDRFDENTRWTGVCQKLLGEEYLILDEGLTGRTTCHSATDLPIPEAPYVNGLEYIPTCILSKLPLDMICVKLGSNDLEQGPDQTPETIAENAARVLRKAKELSEIKYPGKCKYALFAPLEATEDALTGAFADSYTPEMIETAKKVATAFKKKASEEGFLFFDANKVARCGKFDGIHLDAENHKKMGTAMAEWFRENI